MRDPEAKQKFLRWMAAEHPAIYQRAMRQRSQLAGLGFIDAIASLVGVAGQYFAEKKAAKAQAKAERQAKIDAARENARAYALIQQNAARANQGLGPVNAQGQPASLTSYLPYAFAGVGVIALVFFKRRR